MALEPDQVDEIVRLLTTTTMARRAIARQVGVPRRYVEDIYAGKVRRWMIPPEDLDPPAVVSQKVQRCKICGRKARMPKGGGGLCLHCKMLKEVENAKHSARGRAGGLADLRSPDGRGPEGSASASAGRGLLADAGTTAGHGRAACAAAPAAC